MNKPDSTIRSLCLALPAYNEEAVIEPLIHEVERVFKEMELEWTLVVVDDGSKDRTAEIVRGLAADRPWLRLVQHPQNRGLGGAIITGLKTGLELAPDPAALQSHLIVGMDADLTHPPETVPSMVEAANVGTDLVIASRYQPGSEQHGVPAFRLLLSWGARMLFQMFLSLPGVRDYTCGFRAFRASLVKQGFDHYGLDGLITRSGFACTDELLVHLAALGPVIREVPFILRYDRKIGESKLNLGVTVVETLKLLRDHRAELKKHRQD